MDTGLEPLGHKGVSFNTTIKHDNADLELDFLRVSVACVLLHPENIGSVTFTQPASIWDFAECRDLLDWKGHFRGSSVFVRLVLA